MAVSDLIVPLEPNSRIIEVLARLEIAERCGRDDEELWDEYVDSVAEHPARSTWADSAPPSVRC